MRYVKICEVVAVVVWGGSGGDSETYLSHSLHYLHSWCSGAWCAHRWKPPVSVTVLPGWWWIFIEYWWMLVIGEWKMSFTPPLSPQLVRPLAGVLRTLVKTTSQCHHGSGGQNFPLVNITLFSLVKVICDIDIYPCTQAHSPVFCQNPLKINSHRWRF